MRPITLVSATRVEEQADVKRLPIVSSTKGLNTILVKGNRDGLPEAYNRHLSALSGQIAVFVHDDVYIDETADRLHYKLNQAMDAGYQIVGLAGTNNLLGPRYSDASVWWQAGDLSGAVAHRHDSMRIRMTSYGPMPSDVKLLDGLFLAVDVDWVVGHGISFDERFTFHYYDMDFCYEAHKAGLRLTTWPIWVWHESPGATTEEARIAHTGGATKFFSKHWETLGK